MGVSTTHSTALSKAMIWQMSREPHSIVNERLSKQNSGRFGQGAGRAGNSRVSSTIPQGNLGCKPAHPIVLPPAPSPMRRHGVTTEKLERAMGSKAVVNPSPHPRPPLNAARRGPAGFAIDLGRIAAEARPQTSGASGVHLKYRLLPSSTDGAKGGIRVQLDGRKSRARALFCLV